jgi:error-prone DNA polymerase
MGFYAPAQIVRDARRHGVEVRPVDVNRSDWDCTLEPGPRAAERLHPDNAAMAPAIRSRCAVRLGLRQVKGLGEADMTRLVAERGGGYDSVRDLWLRTGLPRAKDTRAEDLPLFAAADAADLQREAAARLPPMPPGEEVINDYRFVALSLKAHPAAFVRGQLEAERIVPAATIGADSHGRRRCVAGLVLVRQRPGSARGVIFMTVEDETGIANIVVWPKVFEAHRQVVLGARFIAVGGRIQSHDGVVHLVAERLWDRTALLGQLTDEVADWDTLDRADEVRRPGVDMRTEVKPRSRLARLIKEAPELAEDAREHIRHNRRLADSLAAHRKAAEAIAASGGTQDGGQHGKGPPPAPRSTWGTARSAAADLSRMGEAARRAASEPGSALPKGRNFH